MLIPIPYLVLEPTSLMCDFETSSCPSLIQERDQDDEDWIYIKATLDRNAGWDHTTGSG